MPYFLEVESKYILLFVLCKVLAKKKTTTLTRRCTFWFQDLALIFSNY